MASIITGAASASPSFDAAAWFAEWSDHGGIAMLAGDRLYLSRLRTIDSAARQKLDALRSHIHAAQAGSALAALLEARSRGGVQ